MNRPSLALIHGMLVVMLVLSGLDQTILATALRSITHDLDGQNRASWIFSAYLIASTVVIPLYGKLADRWGTRRLLLAATGLFTLGSLACGLCSSMTGLILARALQGMGGGGLMTLTMLSVSVLYPPAQRGRQQALLGAAYGVATMVGPLLGAFLVQYFSWRWAFLVNVPVAMAAWGTLARADFGHPQPRLHHRLDLAGAALLAATLVCLLVATRHDGAEVGAGVNWLLVGAGVKLLLIWLAVERRAEDPIVPLSMFRQPGFSAAAVISTLSGVALFGALVFLPFYLQAALLKTPTASAWHLLPLMTGIVVAAAVSGKALRADMPVRYVAIAAWLTMCLSFIALAWVCHSAPSKAWLIAASVLPLGLGLGLLFPLVTMVSQRSSHPNYLGTATSTPIMLRALGGAMGVAIFGELLTRHLDTTLRATAQASGGIDHAQFAAALASGLQGIFVSGGVICLAGCLAASLLPRSLPTLAMPGAGTSPTFQDRVPA